MPITTIAEWDNEYARLARMASQIRSGVVAVNTGGGSSSSTDLPTGLSRLEDSLRALPLPPTEAQRRRRLVQHLQQTTGVNAGGGGGVGGGNNGQTPQQYQAQSQMQLAMQQQDSMIDELAVGVGRLKQQTYSISDEANMHVNLLNDVENNLDSAQQGLEDETRRAARLKEDRSVWRLQLIVAGLSVLLILLIVMGISP